MKKMQASIQEIDACLPQTQCRQCGYNGCLPYAEALSLGQASIDQCPPGGVTTLLQLAQLLGYDPTTYMAKVASNTRPNQVVQIDESHCIGCTKCIAACPVDAIVGAAKLMHTVIADHCTGCELCIEPCPVDCIHIHTLPMRSSSAAEALAAKSRQRYQQHQLRLQQRQEQRRQKHSIAKKQAQQSYILAAIKRVKQKREPSHASLNEE